MFLISLFIIISLFSIFGISFEESFKLGVLTLMNNDLTKACMFLLTDSAEKFAEGICSVYDIRPKGCQIYPTVLNSEDQAIIDDGCPYGSDFDTPTEEDSITLLNLEERLMRGE